MKKILVILATLALLVGCSSSSNKERLSDDQVYQIYADAISKLQQVNSYTTNGSVSSIVTSDGESIEISSNTIVKVEGINSNDPKMQLNMSSQLFGTTVEQIAYYSNGYLYVDVGGYKVKEASDFNTVGSETSNNYFSTYKSISYSIVDNQYVIHFNLSDEQIESIFSGSQSDAVIDITSIKRVNNRAIVDMDGYLIGVYLDMEATAGDSDYTYELQLKMNFEYSDYNTTVVELPDDLDTYLEQ